MHMYKNQNRDIPVISNSITMIHKYIHSDTPVNLIGITVFNTSCFYESQNLYAPRVESELS